MWAFNLRCVAKSPSSTCERGKSNDPRKINLDFPSGGGHRGRQSRGSVFA